MEWRKILQDLNEWTSPGILRRFQQDLIEENHWRWVTHMQYGRIFLKSLLIPDMVFLTGEIGTGFKIEFYFKDEELCPIPGTNPKKLNRKNEFESLAKKLLLTKVRVNQISSLSIGHPNFAHFIRDQLPALLKMEGLISEKVRYGKLDAIITEYDSQVLDAFGGIGQLLPLFPVTVTKKLSGAIPNNTFSIGSRILSHEAHLRVKSQFITRESLGNSHPKLVLSHRLEGRMPSNTEDLFTELTHRWIVEYHGQVVLDGWNLTHTDAREDISQRVKVHAKYLENLGNACLERIPESLKSRFTTTVSMSLRDSILSMEGVIFQVTPWGTVHHKCAWVWNPERLILLPPSNENIFHQTNIGNHFESSRAIYFLPDHEVLDDSSGREDYVTKPYRVADVKRAAELILSKA